MMRCSKCGRFLGKEHRCPEVGELSRIRLEKLATGEIKVWNTGLTKETDERLNYVRPTVFKAGNTTMGI